MTQLALDIPPACKQPGCTQPIVGSSITGDGRVCRRHNELEWRSALLQSPQAWVRDLGALISPHTKQC